MHQFGTGTFHHEKASEFDPTQKGFRIRGVHHSSSDGLSAVLWVGDHERPRCPGQSRIFVCLFEPLNEASLPFSFAEDRTGVAQIEIGLLASGRCLSGEFCGDLQAR